MAKRVLTKPAAKPAESDESSEASSTSEASSVSKSQAPAGAKAGASPRKAVKPAPKKKPGSCGSGDTHDLSDGEPPAYDDDATVDDGKPAMTFSDLQNLGTINPDGTAKLFTDVTPKPPMVRSATQRSMASKVSSGSKQEALKPSTSPRLAAARARTAKRPSTAPIGRELQALPTQLLTDEGSGSVHLSDGPKSGKDGLRAKGSELLRATRGSGSLDDGASNISSLKLAIAAKRKNRPKSAMSGAASIFGAASIGKRIAIQGPPKSRETHREALLFKKGRLGASTGSLCWGPRLGDFGISTVDTSILGPSRARGSTTRKLGFETTRELGPIDLGPSPGSRY
ncbi:hypothetical protein M885DRAFT_5214 [Pelagophyceae sp. CCMP2097]|nr:hypothetical protein M885DRAFT_5214 [Pelagophyceae sp. CCMP2097]